MKWNETIECSIIKDIIAKQWKLKEFNGDGMTLKILDCIPYW